MTFSSSSFAFAPPLLLPNRTPFLSIGPPNSRNLSPSRRSPHHADNIPRRRFVLPTTTTTGSALLKSTATAAGADARVKFPALRPDAFRHPIDIRATRLLKSFIGLESALRLLLRTVEQTLFFENIATGVKVTARQYASIYHMTQEACDVLDIPVPQVYIRQNPTPNAYTLAVQSDKAFIVIHTALVDLLSADELQAVIAHELGHLKSEHGIWVTMANLLLLASSSTLPGLVARPLYDILNMQLMAWQRSAELTCDRAMLLVVQDTPVAMSALMKLTGGISKYSHEMDVDEFLDQADQFDKASQSWIGRRVRDSMTSAATHPLPILRVRELKRWSESNHFRSLLQSGKPLAPIATVEPQPSSTM